MKTDLSQRTRGKRVQLMATCLCDAFFADVARATVQVLEFAGCVVEFPEGQTCCGQPAFNGGDWASSRKVVRHTLKVFRGDLPIVVPSGSCAAMMFHGAPLEFEKESDLDEVNQVAGRTWELADFLVNGLGRKEWGGRYPARVAIHHSCHTRGTGTGQAMRTLLESVEGLEQVEFAEPEQCCGFGGTFSVSFPHISSSMGRLKIGHILEMKPDFLLSADMSCMMHLRGLAEKQGQNLEIRHIAQVLRDAVISQGGGE